MPYAEATEEEVARAFGFGSVEVLRLWQRTTSSGEICPACRRKDRTMDVVRLRMRLTMLLAVAGMLAAWTPTTKDDEVVAFARKLLEEGRLEEVVKLLGL